MKRELKNYIEKNKLNPFNKVKTQVKQKTKSIYKTSDAKKIHRKVLNKISENFVFLDTSSLLSFFEFVFNENDIRERQEFFRRIKSFGRKENSFLKNLEIPRKNWTPDYDVVVVTEDGDTFNELKNKGIPSQLIVSENDLQALGERDIVQVLDCAEFSIALEQLPQSVFLNSVEEAYLERYLEELSGWKNNFKILRENSEGELKEKIEEIYSLFELIKENTGKKILNRDEIEDLIQEINEKVTYRAKELSVTGESLVEILSKGVLPKEIKDIVQEEIKKANIPEEIIKIKIPLEIDEEELEKTIAKQNTEKFSSVSEKIKENSNKIKDLPERLKEISQLILEHDFVSGISKFIKDKDVFPEISIELNLENSYNLFLERPQPVSFVLNEDYKASILTGANSGGKTTLMEHIIQFISLKQLGLPVNSKGKANLPLFSEVYYFAKNKGDISKGAFENLLDQMSKIEIFDENKGKVLILADEIESVTEPGVAGKIISATADYFLKKGCYLVFATHLGHEIKNFLPEKIRIDGIEAQGLDEDFNLIVNHNPVLGRLANSTPELIVERLAKSRKEDYFKHLDEFLKG